MSVTPCTDLWVLPEVFIADIVSAYKSGDPIHDDNLTVVAEVELKAVGSAFARIEWANIHPRRTKFIQIAGRQSVAADFIVKHEAVNAHPCFGNQRLLEPPAKANVMDDVKLHEY